MKMQTEGPPERGEPVEPGRDDGVVLWVRLAPGEPLAGSIGDAAHSESFFFRGWIDFMGAINALRRSGAPDDMTRS